MIDLTRPELAINGGKQTRSKSWPPNTTTAREELRAVKRVMRSGSLSAFEGAYVADDGFSFLGGVEVQSLESEWSEAYQVPFSVAVNSATSGLFAAVGALSLGYGDEVIVSPYTMSACALAPLIYGAIPVFADVDPNSGCLDPRSILQKISPRTKAIIVVHQFGFPADMDRIMQIAERHKLKVIEDCAQAHGATFRGLRLGTIGDIGVFSLNVNKTLQAGEGGVCVTSDSDLAFRLRLIRNHGEAVVEAADYRNIENIAGFNYRMTELTAAVAREQLKKLNRLTASRLELVEQFRKGLREFEFLEPLDVKRQCWDCRCAGAIQCLPTYYVFPLKFRQATAGVTRDAFASALSSEGIKIYQGYVKPLYLQPLYQRRVLFKHGYPFSAPANVGTQQNYSLGECPIAERLHFEELVVFEHIRPPSTGKEVEDILTAIEKVAS